MNGPTLRFREDGTFRILQLTDMHLQQIVGRNATSLALAKDLIEREKPDLIAFTGDISCDGSAQQMVSRLETLLNVVEPFGIPYTYTMGNHETDRHNGQSRHGALAEFLLARPLCIFDPGDAKLGMGNYEVHVYPHDGGGRPAWALYHLDGHSSHVPYHLAPGVTEIHDAWITIPQQRWLEDTHKALQRAYGSVPAILFDHVPLPEYNDVWMFDGVYGDRFEKVYSPKVNSGLFSRLYELGDFRGVFCGHDHVNSYHGTMLGIMLAYGRCSGYHTYCQPYFKRGGRVIVLGERSGQIEDTYITLHDGTRGDDTFHPPVLNRLDLYMRDVPLKN